ncbi:hypothetical protein VN21_16950 [Paraclostridium benzoelyticum]|uniref:Uncharacterized protein n=1 Tax=Paraclostridium benzoelyticum TaxID=1629550 RepID=A0A0M3DEQ4_9FIRM|nr:hypothetical protein [Paraclostridium benzoelyticum]KKX99938.1 hypothetical protein VN21_16950 [Paraclostridium benzoelyticum]
MKEFNLKSGTSVIVENTKITILRNDGKSAMKGLFVGRAMGQMVIRLSSVSGMIQYADYMLICSSGLPTPNEFKISNIADIKQYPNCIVGKENELKEVYDYINNLI